MPELKNIDQLPLAVRERVSQYALRLLDIHNGNIESIIVYGSAAGINFNPRVSDINLAVIFKDLDFNVFEKSLKLAGAGRRQHIPAPLFLTKHYIHTSLDVFPIEFNEIKDQHVLIWGEDVFTSLTVDARHMKVFCEAQIKGKLLHLRQAYLESGGNDKTMKSALSDALGSLIPIFRQLVRLSGENPAVHREELFKQLGSKFSIDAAAMSAVYKDKGGAISLRGAQTQNTFREFVQQLEHLAASLD